MASDVKRNQFRASESNCNVSTGSQHAEWTLNEIEKLSTESLQDERACTRGSEKILFEILHGRP